MKAPDLFRRPPRAKSTALRQRFRVLEFTNPRTDSQSWRVSGIKRDGSRVRENHIDGATASLRCLELETEFHNADNLEATALRATRLPADSIRIAETAFARLDRHEDLLAAVDHWLRVGRHQPILKSPRLDDAVSQFKTWLDTTPDLRPRTKVNLRNRVQIFAGSVGNLRVADVTPDTLETFLDSRRADPVTRDNDKRALSRFFSWCIERPRRWLPANPAREVKVRKPERPPPIVLTVDQCEALLRAAQDYNDGELVPYIVACLFAGLRPGEAARLDWPQVNLSDKEIRLEGIQTKTGRPRVVAIHPTLARWLNAYPGKPFFPSGWRKHFAAVKTAAGLDDWTVDVLRHTAISHFLRLTGSYGRTAEEFGNSEAIIKRHYQGRVSTADTKRFFQLTPEAIR